MKKLVIMGVLTLLGCLMEASAYDIKDNPDRKISFGINYDHTGQNSEYKFGANKISDFTKISQNQVIFDVKVPLASFLTFGLRGGVFGLTNDIYTGEQVSGNGYDIGFGVRFYVP